MLSPQIPVIHAQLNVLTAIKWRVPTTCLHAISTVTIKEYDQNSMKYDVDVVYAYKFRNKFVHIYKKQSVFLYTCKRGKSLQWIWQEIIKHIRSYFLTDLNTSVQVRVCVVGNHVATQSQKIRSHHFLYAMCWGWNKTTDEVADKICNSDCFVQFWKCFSFRHWPFFFSLNTHGTTLFMIQKWTANSTNISIIEKKIQICIFKANGAWENSAFKAFEIVSFKKRLCSP